MTPDGPDALAVGICAFPAPAPNAPRTVEHAPYIHEMLGHAGLCCRPVAPEDLDGALDWLRVLVTVGETPLPPARRARLARWVREEGGAWVSIGGLCGMHDLVGADPETASYSLWAGSLGALGEGYLDARGSAHPVLAGLTRPLHFFGGVSVAPRGAEVLAGVLDAHHRPTPRPALLERAPGRGLCLVLTPDVTGTVVRVQQGTAVTRDGVSAPDGTGPVGDGVLKSDDGQALDWLLDREPVPGVAGLSAFLQPVADQWRDLVLRAVCYVARRRGVPLPLLWLYPRGLPALGHLSHDTDGNDPDRAASLLDALREADVRSTWCVILPGYGPERIAQVHDAGHELATHFDAMTDGCPWGEAAFDRQWRGLRELFGTVTPVTNKNHYLRWQGDTEFFEWCAARGIRLDQSKGASKTGEAGFNFGTCHPYRPVTPDGRVLPVHELPTPTQDLGVFAPPEIAPPLLDAAVRHHGILHLLFHPAHIEKPGVREALRDAVRAGRERGLEWWTGREIVEWEEARRAARWAPLAGAPGVTLTARDALLGATLLVLAPEGGAVRVRAVAGEIPTARVERWGFGFAAAVCDLGPGETLSLRWGRGGEEG